MGAGAGTVHVALAVLLAAPVGCTAERDLSLKLNTISQATSPKAKCIDGTPPACPLRHPLR